MKNYRTYLESLTDSALDNLYESEIGYRPIETGEMNADETIEVLFEYYQEENRYFDTRE